MDEHERPIVAAFCVKLKSARKEAGLTMAALGALVSPPMQAPAIARYEAGQRVPTWTAVVRLAKALGKPTDYFLPEAAHFKRKGKRQ